MCPAQSATGAPSAHGEPLRVHVITSVAALAAERRGWAELSARALEPNPFYAPHFALPALEELGCAEPLRCVVIRGRAGAWRGFFPLVRQCRYHHLPVSALAAWRTDHVGLCVPLVDAHRPDAVWRAFLDWLRDDSGSRLLELPLLHSGGPVAQALFDTLHARGTAFVHLASVSRAFLAPASTAEAYVQRAQSGQHRRKVRTKRHRLSALGPIREVVLDGEEDPRPWARAFLALEHKGWKGHSGTALACTPTDQGFFLRLVEESHAAGQLQFLALYLGEAPLAMKCNLLSGDGSFAWKVAFDEDYARYSPGLLLEEFNIVVAHAEGRWQDSCAVPDSRLFRDLWDRRRTLETVVLPGAPPGAELLVSALPLIRWAARGLERPRQAEGARPQ